MKGSIGHHLIVVHYFLLLILPVNPADVNVAVGRPATQSSTYSSITTADRAVDGNYDTNTYHGSCADTNDVGGLPNWWRVDLGRPMYIKNIVITNRGDTPSCANRLDYFIVGVTNSAEAPVRGCYPLCGQYPSPAVNGVKHYLQCNPNTASGRYVIVQQPVNGAGYLTVCEVEVYTGQVRQTDRWMKNADQRLMTNGTVVLQRKRSALQCIGSCKSATSCDSVNYFSKGQTCEMNYLPRGAINCDLVSAGGWDWWTRVNEFV